MGRRLKQWAELSQMLPPELDYIYDGPKKPNWDGVHIELKKSLQWKTAWLYVLVDKKLIHKEHVVIRGFNKSYYTFRQPDIKDNAHVKIVLELIHDTRSAWIAT